MKLKLWEIILSWDFITSLLLGVVLSIFLPSCLMCEFSVRIYSVGISVIAIIFAVFFASTAIIISSSDNDFLVFLETEVGGYSRLISSYRFTLIVLFIALIYSLTVFSLTSYNLLVNSGFMQMQSKWFFVVFIFLFSYSLFASIMATIDSLRFAIRRIRYLVIKNESS